MQKLTFKCRLIYLTYAGHDQEARYTVQHVAADLAMQKAERLLRADKRRHIGALIYQEAVQC